MYYSYRMNKIHSKRNSNESKEDGVKKVAILTAEYRLQLCSPGEGGLGCHSGSGTRRVRIPKATQPWNICYR